MLPEARVTVEAAGLQNIELSRADACDLRDSLEFSAIVLETGYAKYLRINEYVTGEAGDVADIARTSVMSRLGNSRANVELTRPGRCTPRTT